MCYPLLSFYGYRLKSVGGYAFLRFQDLGFHDANRLNEKYTLRFGCLSFGIGLRLRTLCTFSTF